MELKSIHEKLSKYVIWDGRKQYRFIHGRYDEASIHADSVSEDGELIRSKVTHLNEIRERFAQKFEIIEFFACSPGKPAFEFELDGKWHGVFTYSFVKTMKDFPNLFLRDFVTRLNEEMARHVPFGKEQISQVICPEEFLSTYVLYSESPNRLKLESPVVIFLWDMCRTEWKGKIID